MKYIANKFMRFGGKDVAPGDELDPKDVANNKAYFLLHNIVKHVADDFVHPHMGKVISSDNSHELIQKAAKEAFVERKPEPQSQEAAKGLASSSKPIKEPAKEVKHETAPNAPKKRGKGAL